MNKKMDGKEVSNILKKELQEKINNIKEKLTLAVIQVGNNEASNVYVSKKEQLCNDLGIVFKHFKYDFITENDLIKEIEKLNNDNSITGILVQLPLPKEFNKIKIVDSICPTKDVDGLTSNNMGNLYNNKNSIIPCTALGVLKLLEFYNVSLEGKNVCIIGRTNLLGIPLFKLLLNENCTVTMCHSKTKNIKNITKNSDIIVSATGKKHLIKKDMIKEDAIVIDVGITRVNNKLYGDVDYEDCYLKSSLITPVPGGVGPMTVIMLGYNVVTCYNLQKEKGEV